VFNSRFPSSRTASSRPYVGFSRSVKLIATSGFSVDAQKQVVGEVKFTSVSKFSIDGSKQIAAEARFVSNLNILSDGIKQEFGIGNIACTATAGFSVAAHKQTTGKIELVSTAKISGDAFKQIASAVRFVSVFSMILDRWHLEASVVLKDVAKINFDAVKWEKYIWKDEDSHFQGSIVKEGEVGSLPVKKGIEFIGTVRKKVG